MRRFLDKVIKKPKSNGTQMPPLSPSLPSDFSYDELDFSTKRGFLAIKLSQYLNFPKEKSDFLFYQSFCSSSFLDFVEENDENFLLYLSEQMLIWNDNNQDIPNEIKNTNMRNDIQNAMLKAYQIYQKNLFLQTSFNEVSETKEDTEWKIYRDVISAATQGQFLLISDEEIDQYKSGVVFCEGEIKNRSDIPLCRNNAKANLEKMGIDKSKMMNWLLVLSEAITNTIKHGEEGKMTLIDDEKNNEVRFVIEDKGPGFSLKDLPNMTLLSGYSTKRSMGQGFTLMMKMAQRVLLSNSTEGATIILIFESSKNEMRDLNETG